MIVSATSTTVSDSISSAAGKLKRIKKNEGKHSGYCEVITYLSINMIEYVSSCNV